MLKIAKDGWLWRLYATKAVKILFGPRPFIKPKEK